MYSRNSNLRNIGILAKFIGLMLIVMTIVITNNQYVYLFMALAFFILNKFNILTVLACIMSGISCFYSINLYVKIIFVINYLYMFIKIIDFNQMRYLLETLFYKKCKIFLYKFMKIIYIVRYFKKEYKSRIMLIKNYGFNYDFKTMLTIIKESFRKSRVISNSIITTYKYRCYNYANRKTYIDEDEIDSYDFKYVLVHVLIFAFVFVVGR